MAPIRANQITGTTNDFKMGVINVINSVDNDKLPCHTLPLTQHLSFFRNLLLYSCETSLSVALPNAKTNLQSHFSLEVIMDTFFTRNCGCCRRL